METMDPGDESGLDPEAVEWLRRERAKLPFDQARVVRSKALTARALDDLFRARTVAIHVRGFCDPATARRAAKKLETSRSRTWVLGAHRSDVSFMLGTPWNVSRKSDAALRSYYRRAIPNIRRVRELFSPSLSPVDRLRLELDEIWPAGARLADDEGRKRFVGLVRVMRAERLLPGVAARDGACHVDNLLQPGETRLFSANIYLRVPAQGGELALWTLAPHPSNIENPFYRLFADAGFVPGTQELIHEVLGPPAHVISPEPGDLVLIDTARPHAVRGFPRGDRVQLQSFICLHALDAALTLYA